MDFGDLEQLQAAYRNEAADLLTDLGGALLLLELEPRNAEVINRVFRAMHTLKGSGASAGFRRLAGFVHHVEEVFNRIRNHQLEATPELIDATLKACDCCEMLLALSSSDSDTPLPLETEVLTALRPFLPEMDKAANKTEASKSAADTPVRYKIIFRPNAEIFYSGIDPASLLLELTDLGAIEIHCEADNLLQNENFDPERCYLHWTVYVETKQPEEAVRAVFLFVEDDCSVSIEREEPAASLEEKARTFVFAAPPSSAFPRWTSRSDNASPKTRNSDWLPRLRAAQTLIAATRAHAHVGATGCPRGS